MKFKPGTLPTPKALLWALTHMLTAQDRRDEKRPGGTTPYRLAHYCGAVNDIEKRFSDRLESTDMATIADLSTAIEEALTTPASDRMVRYIRKYLKTGTFPDIRL
jgi:hypothetical protein